MASSQGAFLEIAFPSAPGYAVWRSFFVRLSLSLASSSIASRCFFSHHLYACMSCNMSFFGFAYLCNMRIAIPSNCASHHHHICLLGLCCFPQCAFPLCSRFSSVILRFIFIRNWSVFRHCLRFVSSLRSLSSHFPTLSFDPSLFQALSLTSPP